MKTFRFFLIKWPIFLVFHKMYQEFETRNVARSWFSSHIAAERAHQPCGGTSLHWYVELMLIFAFSTINWFRSFRFFLTAQIKGPLSLSGQWVRSRLGIWRMRPLTSSKVGFPFKIILQQDSIKFFSMFSGKLWLQPILAIALLKSRN